MGMQQFMAAQLSKPSGLFGSLVLGRIMNRVNRKIVERTLELLELSPNHQVLEIGFGGGVALSLLTKRLTSGVVSGVDFSADMVRCAERNFQREIGEGRVRVQFGDVSELPFPEGVFDRVFTINTIYFWPDTSRGLAEIRRVLKNDGRAGLRSARRKRWRSAP
jgi:ubiquinone/menaquinone biosynthesis C-methylase UbiE